MRVVMKETVLILTDAFPPNIGGVESHLYDLCKYLAESDHRVFVVTYQPITTKAKGLKVERRKNLEIHRMQWFGYNLYPKLESYPILLFLYEFPGLFVSSLFFLLKRRKEVDVIHAQGLITGYITKILVKIFKKRCV
ncbi:glycosyltransferase, partial [Candidatus Bathyarchaeota archaeon]|nr:glycosyltransferase [Candidatus Bathyarchaeota archaeon]